MTAGRKEGKVESKNEKKGELWRGALLKGGGGITIRITSGPLVVRQNKIIGEIIIRQDPLRLLKELEEEFERVIRK